MRLGVIGHVEHVTLGAIAAVPAPGDIVHLEAPHVLAGGGGGIAFFQIARSAAEVHCFTALGNDDAAHFVERTITALPNAVLHAARRDLPHTRDLVMVDARGERTIVVVGEPLHPCADDSLPWHLLRELDAVYFTAQDPALLVKARDARALVVTARRRACIATARQQLDVIVGSRNDPREASTRLDYAIPPTALVMTDGPRGGIVETADSVTAFVSPTIASGRGSYGAGDSFAGALTYYIAAGLPAPVAAARAAHHGAAVTASIEPLGAQLVLPHGD